MVKNCVAGDDVRCWNPCFRVRPGLGKGRVYPLEVDAAVLCRRGYLEPRRAGKRVLAEDELGRDLVALVHEPLRALPFEAVPQVLAQALIAYRPCGRRTCGLLCMHACIIRWCIIVSPSGRSASGRSDWGPLRRALQETPALPCPPGHMLAACPATPARPQTCLLYHTCRLRARPAAPAMPARRLPAQARITRGASPGRPAPHRGCR